MAKVNSIQRGKRRAQIEMIEIRMDAMATISGRDNPLVAEDPIWVASRVYKPAGCRISTI